LVAKIKYYVPLLAKGLLNSYGQILFSNNKKFAAVLMLVSFFDVNAGLAGVLAVVTSQVLALVLNYNHAAVKDGSYTYNALLTGIALGAFFDLNVALLVTLVISSVLSFFITVWLGSSLGKKGLPYLSIPFLIVVWLVILAGNSFSAVELHHKDSLTAIRLFPALFSSTTEWIVNYVPFHNAVLLYLRSLGAIFFQYSDLAGLIISVALLLQSRMAFMLSIVGFSVGYIFYGYMEGDYTQLIYSYIGFNFILIGMALGGFFVVSSTRSYLLLLIVIPITAFALNGFYALFTKWNLPIYTLPFNAMVLLMIYALQHRAFANKLTLVTIQNYSAEKNHYRHYNRVERFRYDTYFHISLPVLGPWYISQGHNGKITHKDDWQYAWDFDVRDDYKKTFDGLGTQLSDFNCYDLPVVAPAAGYVAEVVDGIDDNLVGDMNIKNNWGNTIVIKHGELIYSKLSHLKKDSIKIKPGDYVSKGDIIASCGSSGRSPEPHLHFQLQSTPGIGSKTMLYPISYYLTQQGGKVALKSFDVPKEGEVVSNVAGSRTLKEIFNLTPGKKITWSVKNKTQQWEVFANIYNQTYVYCYQTGATAYFVNNGTMFYFTEFYGSRHSLLYQFYRGMHKILLGHYKEIEVTDILQPEDGFPYLVRSVHDFTAPFFHYLSARYTSVFVSPGSSHGAKEIEIEGTLEGKFFSATIFKRKYKLVINADGIQSFHYAHNQQIIQATCVG
jgi:urea transporter/murein DD-endopeptidase MepM/ murein hydrolase activator NlpD